MFSSRIILISSFFLFTSLLVSCLSTTSTNLATCLISNNVSVYRTKDAYYNYLLDFSIQNLRFVESFMPKPTVIIVPESKEQLVSSVLCCTQGSYEIRVRCGGHSYEGTSSVSLDGTDSPFVVIDLMKLDRVTLDLQSGTAWVQGGATLGQTYYAISQASNVHGFAAGSCPTVGVGGHISGGGFGFLSRKYGLAADNVVDALLVDAKGRVLDRKSMGEEVFWAIRGGGGGIWGIIYAWKIRLLKVPKTVTSFLVSRPGSNNYVSRLVHKWQLVAPKLDDEFYLSVSIRSAAASKGIHEINAQFNGLYLGPRNQAISILNEAFPELGILKHDCKEMTMERINEEAIAFPHRKGNLFGIQYLVDWKEEDNSIAKSNAYIEWIRDFYNTMAPFVSSTPRAAYVNYMDLDLGVMDYLLLNTTADSAVEAARTWGQKYFLNNYDRLVKAKTTIDPLNVFRHQQGIPPMFPSIPDPSYSTH
ncbi:unnamed protein product [Withania somnifera]